MNRLWYPQGALNCRSNTLNIAGDSRYEQSLAWCHLRSTLFNGKNDNIASLWVLPEQIDMVRRQHPGVVALRHNRQKYRSMAALVRCDWLGSDGRIDEKTRFLLAAGASAGARSFHALRVGNFTPPLFDLYTHQGGSARSALFLVEDVTMVLATRYSRTKTTLLQILIRVGKLCVGRSNARSMQNTRETATHCLPYTTA
jgi:hypothetical protein